MKSGGAFLWSCLILFLALLPVLWILWRWIKASDEPGVLLVRWACSLVTLLVVFGMAIRARDEAEKIEALIIGMLGGLVMTFIWRQRFCDWVGDMIAGFYTGGSQQLEPAPCYSYAEARRKKGNYTEAITEVQAQLARFPNDFAGLMLLAEIHAEDLKDLAAAQETVAQILAVGEYAPKNIAYALNRLADWHIKLAQDTAGARAALEQIVVRLPETEQAQLALQRIAHLAPAMIERGWGGEAPSVRMQHHVENVGLREAPVELRPTEEDPAVTAANYVKHLEQFPFDNDAREKLALLYARHYRRLDLAADQLEQLIAFPNQPMRHVVRWLNLLADLQVDFGEDEIVIRQTLQRIVELQPKAAAAGTALNRLAHLKLELRGKKQSQAVKLGSYEQNIGLKGGGRSVPGRES